MVFENRWIELGVKASTMVLDAAKLLKRYIEELEFKPGEEPKYVEIQTNRRSAYVLVHEIEGKNEDVIEMPSAIA